MFINLSEINSESENEDVAGFRVADGVDFTGSLRNEGTISGTQNGVSFGDGDHIRNRGFTVDTPGLVTNEEGIISSDSRAFNLDGTGLEINNTGDIIGTDDQRNGTFFASSTAQDFTLNNDGLIDAGEGNDGAGISVELAAGGFGSPSAAISGEGFIGGSDFVIENTGVIQGRGDAADGAATAGDGIRLEQPRVDGVLDDSRASLGGGLFIGEINNSGLINAESETGDVAGFRVTEGAAFGGELNNNGTISGTQNGVDLGGNFTSGDVENNGVISSDSRAVSIGGGEGRNGGEFTNNGGILGTDDQRNGTVFFAEGSVDFNNRGLIDAGEGNDGSGITIEAQPNGTLGNLISDFNNTGLIQGRGNADAGDATAGDGVRFETARVDGALDATNTDQIFTVFANSGVINSEGENGAVSGFRVADGVGFIGDLNNSGTISGTQNGVYFGDGVHEASFPVGDVNNSGTISSDSRALNIDGTGLQVNNNGLIIGTDDQRNGTVYADSTAQDFALNNDGLIDAGEGNEGAGFSAELADTGNDFTIANTEAIRGRGDAAAGTAAAGDGVRLERTRVDGALDGSTTGLFTGEITNDGIFEAADGTNGTVAGFRAVDGVDFQGTLDNTGFITGSQNGVYFGEGDHTGGVVTNSGLITSDSRAVNIDGEGLAFENSGLIEATDRQRNGTVYVDGTADNFEVTNVGTIDAAGGGSGVSVEVGSETGDVQSGSIINGGTIIGSGELAEDAGVRLSAGALGETTFAGDIVNTGTITSEDVAVLIEDGVLFDGDLINNGTIDGEIDLSSGGIVLNDGSVIYLDIAGVNDVEQISTEDEITFGGDLNVRFTEGFVPEFGQTFDLIDFGASSGNFTSVAAEGFDFDTSNLAIDGTVTVLARDGSIEVVDIDDVDDDDVILGDGSVAEEIADGEEGTVGEEGPSEEVDPVVDASTAIVVAEGEQTDIVNPEGGLIASGGTAIEVNGSSTIDNAGFITGGITGVDFAETGTGILTNDEAVISSDSRAVEISGDDVVINNDGDIIGTDDQRNGTVFADSTAEDFTIINEGLIGAGQGNDGAGVVVELAEQTNETIRFTSPEGGSEFEIENNGVIQGRGDAADGVGTAGDGIRLEQPRVDGVLDGTTEGLFNGTITNNGLIDAESGSGDVAGFRITDGATFGGQLINNGTISGTQNGVDLGDDVQGSLVNDGLISSDSQALTFGGDLQDAGRVDNNGAIIGTGDQRNGTVFIEETEVNLTNDGLIDAGEGNNGAGISIEAFDDDLRSIIRNDGLIQGRGNAADETGTAGDGVRVEPQRVDGILDGTTTANFDSDFINGGLIDSEGENGAVAGFRFEDGVGLTARLSNFGTISGTQNGVYFGDATHAGGILDNRATISSDSRAVNIDGTGGLTSFGSFDELAIINEGQIIGTGDQRNGTVFANSTAQDFILVNEGLIDAGEGNLGAGFTAELLDGNEFDTGINFDNGNNFEIRNSGSIIGRGDAAAETATAGDGIRLEPTRVDGALDGSTTGLFAGTIENSGLIAAADGTDESVAGFRTVDGVGFRARLENTGLITGSQNGVSIGDGDHLTGFLVNEGLVSSDSRAVSIDGSGFSLLNTGTIEATDRQRNGTVYVDGTANAYELINRGTIDARGGAGSGISIQVGSETGDVQRGSIDSDGDIFAAGDLAEDAGIRLSAGAEGGTTYSGSISNGGTISTDGAAAILVEDGVELDGFVSNGGIIDGAINLSSGNVLLSPGSAVFLDIAGVDDVEQISTTDEVAFGGDLNVRFTEGFVPEAGQSFDLIDFGTSSGSFDSVAAEGFDFDTSNLAIDGTVTVVGQDGVVEVVAVDDIAEGDVVLGDATVAEEIAAVEDTIAFEQLAAVEATTAVEQTIAFEQLTAVDETAVVAAAATAQDVTVLDDAATVEKVAVAQTQAVATKEAVATQEAVVKDVVASTAETKEAPAELSRDEIRQQERAARDSERAARDLEREARDQQRAERRSARNATRGSFAKLSS